MNYENKQINIFSILVIFVLAIISYALVSTIYKEHQNQKLALKKAHQEKVFSQYENLKSLIYWGANNVEKESQLYTKHFDPTSESGMFGSSFIKNKNVNGLERFKLVSLKPLNEKNSVNNFEKESLLRLEINKDQNFYDNFTDEQYRFVGKLEYKESCVSCHSHQEYQLGDIKGGVSITTPLNDLNQQIESINKEFFIEVVVMSLFLAISVFTVLYFMFIVHKKNRDIKKKSDEISTLNLDLEKRVQDRTNYLNDTIEETVQTLINLVESRDTYTAGHSKRVRNYSMMIARSMGVDKTFLNRLDKASYLHDIGKIDTPDAVLLKPGKLDKLEYELIRNHALRGYEALVKIDAYKNIASIVKYHHERYNGKGYPEGLKGKEIPLEARIIAVADTFDAMTTSRIYKARKSINTALKEIGKFSGEDFDPQVVKHALKVLSSVEQPDATQLPINISDHHRMAYFYKDALTSVYNKEYLYILLEFGIDGRKFKCFNIVSLNNFHVFNKEFGWDQGNQILISFANYLDGKYRESFIIRIFGDNFIILNHENIEIEKSDFCEIDFLKDTAISLSVKHYELSEKYDKEQIEKFISSI